VFSVDIRIIIPNITNIDFTADLRSVCSFFLVQNETTMRFIMHFFNKPVISALAISMAMGIFAADQAFA